MTVSTLVANMGGLLGLCMGLSLVSLVEIALYLVKFITYYFYPDKTLILIINMSTVITTLILYLTG